ncbi:amidase [Nitratireductor aquibiodomus RA22]|uniref:Amidase n=1 Tax=Nitratireductor aquibiodomus RA22 TaxID=1189611 RepID=I5C5C8_9HYPH|nr:amidase family protein [Nitratireductor aquibiodomus]EIM77030.1 amidase [Nitratireductor aquibiodomus RA22]
MHDELWSWNAGDLAKAIRERQVSSREAVESAVARMEAVNPHLNAVVDPLPEAALSEARAADDALARGDTPGILHGVPVTVKINVDYAGRATTNGVRSQADLIAPEDGSVVRNLRAAGAIVIGRTNTPCYSMRWFTDNALHGATLNPHDRDITPGGSSGGAGSAAAAGIGTIAHGNDIGGSIRYPAYCCGVYGLRPTSGLLPSYNPSQLSERMIASQMMAVQGPLARSASDLSLGIEALSRHDPRDVWQVPAPNLTSPEMQKPCRVALFADPEECAVDPEVAQAILLAAERLREAGYQVEEVPIPSISEAAHLWRTVMINEMRSGLLTQIEKNGDAAIRYAAEAFCEGVPELDRTGFLQALASRSTLLRDWQLLFETHPLVLTAVCWRKPYRVGTDQTNKTWFDRFFAELSPTTMPPILGLPGLSVPISIDGAGPLGVQLIANRFHDGRLLAAADAMERFGGTVTPIEPLH